MLLGRWPRWLSLAIGLWLVVSVFAFQASSSGGFNRLIVGILVSSMAVQALWAPGYRWANALFGSWLLFSGAIFDHASLFLALSTMAAGGALVVLAMVPSPPRLTDPRHAFVG